MQIEKLTNQWDSDNKERIERNFSFLSGMEYRLMREFFETGSELDLESNGLPSSEMSSENTLNNYGIIFIARLNCVLHEVSVYAGGAGTIEIVLAKQRVRNTATETLYTTEVSLKKGWNKVVLNYPLQNGVSYNLYRRAVGSNVLLGRKLVSSGFNNENFIGNSLNVIAGMDPNKTGTYLTYGYWFDLKVITNLSQIYRVMNDSVDYPEQFYVGQSPPTNAQFWFRPKE